jgi:hypothetical protein
MENGMHKVYAAAQQLSTVVPVSILSDLRFALDDLEKGFTICEECGHQTDFEDSPLDCLDWVRGVWEYLDKQKSAPQQPSAVVPLAKVLTALSDSLPTPCLPPRPPEGEGLPRYGIQWNGPKSPLSVVMDDGYWTPWHLANQELSAVSAQDGGEWVVAVRTNDYGQVYLCNPDGSSFIPSNHVGDTYYTRPPSTVVQNEPTRIMCEAGACVPWRDKQSEAQWMGEIFRAMMDAAPQQIRAVVPEWFDPAATPPVHSEPVVGYHPEWVDICNQYGVRECFTTSSGGVWLNSAWIEGADSYQTGEMTPLLWTHMPTPPKQEQES